MSGEELLAARPDPVAAFSAPVCGHMNADHIADNIAIVKVACGLVVEDARLLDLDRLGMNAEVKRKGQTFKVRRHSTQHTAIQHMWEGAAAVAEWQHRMHACGRHMRRQLWPAASACVRACIIPRGRAYSQRASVAHDGRLHSLA